MKYVFTNKIYLPHIGGVEIYIHEIAQYLLSLGNEVTVITADTNIDTVVKQNESGESIIRIPAKRIGGLYFLKTKKDYALIEKEIEKADVVHCNDCKFLYIFLARKKKKYNYRLIITSHGWMFHTKDHEQFKHWYFKNVIVKYSKYYDGIICVSDQDGRIAKQFGINKYIVIQNGVDYKKYSDILPKEKYGNNFIYWGRISDNKGIFECLKKLSDLSFNYHFKIAGLCEDNDYMGKLIDFINSHNMKDKVEFLGRISDKEIHDLIKEADFILMPSLHEGFGISLVEGLLSNRPIVANTIESYEYILKEVGAVDYLFDFESSKTSLEIKLDALRDNHVKPINVQQFSLEKMIEKTVKVYSC